MQDIELLTSLDNEEVKEDKNNVPPKQCPPSPGPGCSPKCMPTICNPGKICYPTKHSLEDEKSSQEEVDIKPFSFGR